MSPVKEPNFYAYQGGRPKRAYPPGLPYPEWVVDSPATASRVMEMRADSATFTTLSAYQRLWQDVQEPQRGESSVLYLYLSHVAESILTISPDIKLIAVLRNPVDRAFSHYLMARRMGREPIESFADAVYAEATRLQQGYDPFWHYLSFGFYFRQLKRYYELFDRSQVMIILNEELKQDVRSVCNQLFSFLRVDTSFQCGPVTEFGVGGAPRSRWLYDLGTKPSIVRTGVKRVLPKRFHSTVFKHVVMYRPELGSDLRRQLASIYANDITKLERLIGKDLSRWKC